VYPYACVCGGAEDDDDADDADDGIALFIFFS